MSKVQVIGKKIMSGNNRSHSLRATRRRWNSNLQKFKIEEDGKIVTVKMSAHEYKTRNKTR